jgi:hypothetical protein
MNDPEETDEAPAQTVVQAAPIEPEPEPEEDDWADFVERYSRSKPSSPLAKKYLEGFGD